MTDKDQVLELLMTAMKTSDEVGRLDACIDIVNKLCEVTKEEKDTIIAVLRSARGRQYVKGENAYWEINRMLKEEPTVSKMEQVALKPCPFCGASSQARTYGRDMPDLTWVECTGCRMRTMDCCTKEEAVERWNRRASE